MKLKIALTLLLALVFSTAACDSKEATTAEVPKTEEAQPIEEGKPAADDKVAGDSKDAKTAETGTTVTLTKEGTKFDPAVEKSQIPEGGWFCDMGTAHYARSEKGDGKCPVCNMMLKQKAAEAADDKAGEKADDHDHDGHGHEH